jgi:hypothetical protein
MAPIRAQAKVAIASSGIIGRYKHDLLFYSLFLQYICHFTNALV